MSPLYDPPPCFETSFPLDGLGFFSTLADMGRKAKFAKDIAYFLIVVALVQTHSLRMLLCWLWTLDDDALNRGADQLHIRAIGPLNRQADRHSMPFCQHTAFHPTLAA